MQRLLQLGFIVLASASVAAADAFIKKAAVDRGDFWSAMKHPVMIFAYTLYFLEIVLFVYVFVKKWNLGIVGIIQAAVYSILVILSGIILFKEELSFVQGLGIVIALVGIVLMNV